MISHITSALLLGSAAAQISIPKATPAVIDPVVTPGQPVGDVMPSVGFGTWQLPDNDVGADAVARAIKLGYRHIDGATAYSNQGAVGKGIAKALRENPEIKREHIWVTTKVWATRHKDVKGGHEMNLKQLGLDYIDLALVHFPIGNSQQPVKSENGSVVMKDGKAVTETVPEYDYVDMWKQLEQSLQPDSNGFRKIRHIGISNFNVTQLEDLLAHATVKPYTHQIEAHPYLQDWKFYDVHQKLGVPLSAYAPLGNTNTEYHYRNWKSAGRLMLDDPVLKSIAKARGCTPAQVAIKWNLERKVPVIVKAFYHDHQVENYEANQCKLQPEDLAKIKALDKDGTAGKRFWDMCCAMYAPCYLGLQDAPLTTPVPADYCEDPWKGGSVKYNRERKDLWATTKVADTCQRQL